jgi:uncharacterized damage-inducible protein DinB
VQGVAASSRNVRAISLFGWWATGASVHPTPPAKTNWLTNACGTPTAVNSIDEAQNSGSTEYPRRTAGPGDKSRFEMLVGSKEHEIHHRAQLMVIERLIGIVPHLTRNRQRPQESAQRTTT